MALVVETGAGVANSNSYVSRAEFIAFAADIGVTIADTTASDALLIKAAQYINAHQENFKGARTARDQSMPWPRYMVIIDDWYYNYNEIPPQIKTAQYFYALDLNDGVDLFNRPVNPGLGAIEKQVGKIRVMYGRSKSLVDAGAQKGEYESRGDSYLGMCMRNNFSPMIALERN